MKKKYFYACLYVLSWFLAFASVVLFSSNPGGSGGLIRLMIGIMGLIFSSLMRESAAESYFNACLLENDSGFRLKK